MAGSVVGYTIGTRVFVVVSSLGVVLPEIGDMSCCFGQLVASTALSGRIHAASTAGNYTACVKIISDAFHTAAHAYFGRSYLDLQGQLALFLNEGPTIGCLDRRGS